MGIAGPPHPAGVRGTAAAGLRHIVTAAIVGLALATGLGVAALAQNATPGFEVQTPPTPPDYADDASWAVLPSRPSLADQTPGGGTSRKADAGVDVFYIHPTTYTTRDRWNQDVGDDEVNAWTDVSVIARQASVFNGCCRIFAPRYRQASRAAFGTADGDKAYALAYQDVKRAFDYYLAHYNHGRPFILAGHSQGALHVYRLLAEEVDAKPLQRRLVAAYPVGVPIAMEAFGSLYTSLKPCLKPLQTGCLVSWNSLIATADPSGFITEPRQAYVRAYTGGGAQDFFCINPLTFDVDRPAAPADANLGALPWPPVAGPLPPLVPGAAGAACRRGVLMVQPAPGVAFRLLLLPGGLLHYQDFDLFYRAVRDNAVARSNAFLEAPRADGPARPTNR